MIRGEVHDENAYALGGASGHAGLFGTIDGVLDFARSLLDGSALSPESIKAIRTRESEKRTVGWEGFYPGWHGGDSCSPGHHRPYGLHGHRAMARFRARARLVAAHQPVHPSRHKDSGILPLRRATGEQVIALFDRRAT